MTSVKEVLDEATSSGKFFSVVFTKKDGTERKMLCRAKVRSHLKGGEWANGTAGEPKDHGLVVVYDLQKKAYRSFHIDKITSITFRGETTSG